MEEKRGWTIWTVDVVSFNEGETEKTFNLASKVWGMKEIFFVVEFKHEDKTFVQLKVVNDGFGVCVNIKEPPTGSAPFHVKVSGVAGVHTNKFLNNSPVTFSDLRSRQFWKDFRNGKI